jgi:hypothetical protein
VGNNEKTIINGSREEPIKEEVIEERTQANFTQDKRTNPVNTEETIKNILKNIFEDAKGEKEKFPGTVNFTFNTMGDHAVFTESTVKADNIFDSNIQGTVDKSNSNSEKKSQIFDLKEDSGFTSFVNEYADTYFFYMLVAVASLEIVPDTYVYNILHKLNTILPKKRKDISEDTEGNYHDAYTAHYDILYTIGAQIYVSKTNTEAGLLETAYIKFEDDQMASRIRKKLWTNYPALRELIIDWLLSIQQEYKNIILFRATAALAYYSELNFEFSKSNIIRKLKEDLDYKKIISLANIFELAIKNLQYKENALKMISHWITLENSGLWQVGLRLYALGIIGEEYEHKIVSLLVRILDTRDLEGTTTSFLFLEFRNSLEYIIAFAHKSQALVALIVEAVSILYINSINELTKRKVALIFGLLLREDYLMVSKSSTELKLLSILNNPIYRLKLKGLVVFCWQEKSSRDRLENVLELYFTEAARNGYDWEPLQSFLKIVGFTGRKQDFENLIDFLGKISRNSVEDEKKSRIIQKWLLDLKNENTKRRLLK